MSQDRLSRLRTLGSRLGLDRDWYLIVLATLIGLIMGFAVVGFMWPISKAEALLEGIDGERGSWMIWAALCLPIAGALVTGLLFWLLPIRLRGHGVSICMYSVSREQSRLPVLLGVRQWLGSTSTIASGGSAGPEGPIVTIGATIGSIVGRLLRTDPQNTATLLGCGAAAGLASVFNAPMAGIFFVLEVILRDFSIRTFTPIVIAAVISAATTQMILGSDQPLFGVGPDIFGPHNAKFTVLQTPEFMVLGIVCGIVAVIFGLTIRWTERLFHELKTPKVFKPAIGAAVLVALGISWFLLEPFAKFSTNHEALPNFYGNGYLLIKELLKPEFYDLTSNAPGATLPAVLLLMLFILIFLKIVATTLTLGSGGAGGLFAPSLVVGAVTGSFMGVALESLGLISDTNPAQFALVGMAAVVAATTHAPLTGIVLVYEVTRNYSLMLPLMLTAVIATIVARILTRDSIYAADLKAMGVRIGRMSDLTLLRRMSVRNVPMIPPVIVREDESGQRLIELSERFSVNDFVVVDDEERYLGLVTGSDLRQALVYREAIPLLQVGELERKDLPTVLHDDTLDVVLDKFSANDVQSLAVISPGNQTVLGLITRARLMREYQRELDKD
jgi:CIC family chloride channel protein